MTEFQGNLDQTISLVAGTYRLRFKYRMVHWASGVHLNWTFAGNLLDIPISEFGWGYYDNTFVVPAGDHLLHFHFGGEFEGSPFPQVYLDNVSLKKVG